MITDTIGQQRKHVFLVVRVLLELWASLFVDNVQKLDFKSSKLIVVSKGLRSSCCIFSLFDHVELKCAVNCCAQFLLPAIVHINHQPYLQRGDGPIVSLHFAWHFYF